MHPRPDPVRRSAVLAVLLCLALLALLVVALSIGPVRIDFAQLLSGHGDAQQNTALWMLRLPRALLAILAGAALAFSGALMQTYFRNPLAEPYITGVSAGGALGAVLGQTLGLDGRYGPAACALLGAALITAALYSFALRGRSPGATSTLLLGIALGTFCGAVVWFLLLLQGPGGAQQAMAWLLGRVSTVGYSDVLGIAPALLLGTAIALFFSRDLDALLLGDEKAASLGVNLAAARRGILAAATLMAAACVAFCGVIAFVGLMVPHVVRNVSGGVHRRLLPLSALGGAVLLLFTDIASRTVHPPGEVPLTVLTSLIGAPFFIWVLLRSRNSQLLACMLALLLGAAAMGIPGACRAQEDEIDLDEDSGEAIEVQITADSAEIDLGSGSVEGQRSLEQILGDSAVVSVIREAELAGSGSLAEVLERVPGVDVRSDGGFGQLSVAMLRGSRAQQVLVLIDGQPLSPGQVSDLSAIPPGLLERVEVVRGPEAARFGSGALGGVINLVSSRPASEGSKPGDLKSSAAGMRQCQDRSELELGAGSNGLARMAYSTSSANSSVYLSHEQARNDFSFERGAAQSAVRENNEARQDTLWARWKGGATDWGFGARLLRRGVPGAAEFPTTQASLSRESIWAQAGRDSWRADLQAEHSHFRDPQPYLGQSQDFEDTRLSLALSAGRLALGRQPWGLKPHIDYVDSRQYGVHSRAGLDASYGWSFKPDRSWTHSLELGGLASSDSGLDPSFRLGSSWQIDRQNRIYLAGGYSIRQPDFSELYLSGGGVQGNPELQPERLLSAELGADMAFPTARFTAAAFYQDYRESILFLPVSSYLVQASNTGPAKVAGAEMMLDWQLRDAGRSASLPLTRRECWLRSSYTWLPLAEFDSGTALSGRAEHHLNARLEYSSIDGADPPAAGQHPYGRGWSGAFDFDYSSELPADLFGNLRIDARSVCGLEMVRSLGGRQLQLGVRNLFDVNTRDSWNYPLPGREYYLTLRSDL